MKYAVVTVLDQTIGLWDGVGWTTKHKEARLVDLSTAVDIVVKDTVSAAIARLTSGNWTETQVEESAMISWIEEVIDEDEFRSRPDTW